MRNRRVIVVIPCYRVGGAIVGVVGGALEFADHVICVDDACPEESGRLVESEFTGQPVSVIHHERNLGVGGAVKSGYRAALEMGCEVVVKLDGDGQMDPHQIPRLVKPIQDGVSDYCKGNRFFELQTLGNMPGLRLFGNSILSLFTKISSGYWQLLDPTNGFTAIGAHVLPRIPLDKVADGYFFESDLLFRLNIARAVVTDIPMDARYGDEQSNLQVAKVVGPFLAGNLRNLFKRIFYSYFLRNFNIASLQFVVGNLLLLFGCIFGAVAWANSVSSGIPASAGTVMLAGLPIILGFQLLLSFLNYDIQNEPQRPLERPAREPGQD